MVKCLICEKEFRSISNTHLSSHGLTLEEYSRRFPGASTCSLETTEKVSKSMLGVNKGNKRPDARKRMEESNPMKNPEYAKAMGKTRSRKIAEGTIDALKNLGHLPTPKELAVADIFKDLDIPLTYVGDGQKWIAGHCPDFINEDLKIVLELDLDKWWHPKEKAMLENIYLEAGWRCITLTKIDRDHIQEWVTPFFQPIKWEKIEKIEHHGAPSKVYNFHIVPNENFFANRILTHNCFADYFRHSLYTSFFDNGKNLGLRHSDPAKLIPELDKLMAHRGEPVSGENEVINAIRLGVPMRLGIRFEDFLVEEKEVGVSLAVLNYLADIGYPVMINTKSNLPGDPAYVEALARNKGKAAIHFTLISSDDVFLKKIEPGAPSFHERLEAARRLSEAGVRVVARIEPWMVFLNDDKAMVDEYIGWIKEAGIHHLTFDSYSYSANSKGLEANFAKIGMDWRRMFTLSADSQGLSSLLLGKFMEYFRSQGLNCSTFDQGNVPDNQDWICCSVGDWFSDFNWGAGVIAIKYIKQNGMKPTRWSEFDKFVEEKGGWLSQKLKLQVHTLWNGEGDAAWPVYWGQGIEACGTDEDGIVWCWKSEEDFRYDIIDNLTGNLNPRAT